MDINSNVYSEVRIYFVSYPLSKAGWSAQPGMNFGERKNQRTIMITNAAATTYSVGLGKDRFVSDLCHIDKVWIKFRINMKYFSDI